MTDRLFIQVILPLRLEWEPYYYLEAKGEQTQPAVGPAAVAGQDHQPTRPAAGQYQPTVKPAAVAGQDHQPTWPAVGQDQPTVKHAAAAGQDHQPTRPAVGQANQPDEAVLKVGDRVRVDFAGKEYVGVVSAVDVGRQAEALGIVDRIKPIAGKAEGLAPVSLQEIALWRQISEYYLCTVGEVYKAAYPAQKVAEEAVQSRLEAMRAEREEKARARIEDKVRRLRERIEKKAELAGKARKEETRERYLKEKEELEKEELEKEVAAVLGLGGAAAVSANGNGVENGNGVADEDAAEKDAAARINGKGIVLSAAQEEAYSEIKEIFGKGKPVLLHGVTGSGKTEIYLKLARETLARGKNVLYLVPEIALSRQLEDRIGELFPEELLVFHSGETMARKRETASVLRSCGEAGRRCLVLGTRSAIFLPHKDLGLVIIDEEHDTSYKQDSPAPRYNGRETAIMMARIFAADVILGSATPSLESLYNCSVGRYGLVTLSKRYYDAADSDIEIIDTIAERRKNGMVGSFSRKLIDRVNHCLSLRRQVLILRERRAYSPVTQCQECGVIPKCRSCNVSLSLHRRADGTERLVCHYCGRVYEYTGKCPECGGALKPLGAGTQKVEEEAARLFPGARIARLDSDTAQSRKYETEVIRQFSKGEIDILIGTRMVAKGFDFSGLTLVAVLQADSILGQEDYRADERGLQLLEQFRGRCGRRGEKGLFVIQTSQPDHPVYQNIDGKIDDSGMMARFLGERKMFGYPPYSRVIGVIIKDYNQARADLLSRELAEAIRGALGAEAGFAAGGKTGPDVIGPYAPAVDKVSGQNIRQIRVLLPKDRSLARNKGILAATVERFEKERKYSGHIALDVDPA
uniref:replication restart helicase PriA n=1 Tax=Candidatus Cryptobacteroides bacterium TaxID=3085639 RepID=UPI004024DD3A